ncbi:MAG: transglutaminase domain-containing protein [Planctomycetota bacterium]
MAVIPCKVAWVFRAVFVVVAVSLFLFGTTASLLVAWLGLAAVATGADDFLELDGRNGFHDSPGIPRDAVEKLKEVQGTKTARLKCIAFTPDGDWVVLFDDSGFCASNTNLPAVKKLTELRNEHPSDFKCVAFAPSGGWAVLWGQCGSWTEGRIPEDARNKIAEIGSSGGTLRSIAFSPNGGWILLCGKTGVFYGGIPQDLVKVLENAIRDDLSVRCVAFAPTGDWICLTNGGWWTSNIDMPASKLMDANAKRGPSPKWLAFLPEDAGKGPCWLETKPSQTIVATLTTEIAHPDAKVDEWYLYAPQVPNLPSQQAVKTTFVPKGIIVREGSPLKRPVILARITDGRKEVHTVLTIQATLMSRRLRALTPGQKAPEVPELSPESFKNQTCSTMTLDFTSKPFQAWMTGAGMKRHNGETDMAFARRVFAYIKHHFRYQWPTPEHTASRTCVEGKSDCGGLSAVFASTMRANRVPARLLAGRWAKSQKPGDRIGVYGQWHVKAEFFARGVGWVPVDASGAVGDTRGGDFVFFGNDPGDAITMASGQDLLLDSFVSGKQNISVFQGITYWWRGSGEDKSHRFDDLWTVRKEKMPDVGQE